MKKPITGSEIFQQHFRSIYNYVYFRVGNTADAEDISSIVMEKIVKNLSTFVPKKNATIRSWIFAITRNCIADFYQAKKDVVDIHSTVVQDHSPMQDEMLDRKTDILSLHTAIAKLPAQQKKIILLRYKADLSNKEIASLLGIDPQTVSGTLSKAIRKLESLI